MTNVLIFLNLFFGGRLFFYNIDQVIKGSKIELKTFWTRAFFGLLIFIFVVPILQALLLFIFYLLLQLADSLIIPKQEKHRVWWYGLLFSLPYLSLLFPSFLFTHLSKDTLSFALAAHIPSKMLLILLGFILIIKEGTIVIRLALNSLKTVPTTENQTLPDQEEYERGKWIGILERTFVYFLVIFNQIGAIAVIIALKSLARFNELNKKSFAEYFLIGSLLSLLVAALPAVVVRLLM